MRCLSCHYDLSNLSAGVHRCPECGRIFDAADPQTFDTDPAHPRWVQWLATLAVIILLAVSASLLAVWLKRLLF